MFLYFELISSPIFALIFFSTIFFQKCEKVFMRKQIFLPPTGQRDEKPGENLSCFSKPLSIIPSP